jgi:hypothetical protein
MDSQRNELRQRLRELLTVPERERTDPQWDEIIELEIRLAPGNQIDPNRANEPAGGQNFRPRPPKSHQGQPRKQGQGQQGRRPNKGNPQRGGGGGNSGGNTGGGGNAGGNGGNSGGGNGNGGGTPPPQSSPQ